MSNEISGQAYRLSACAALKEKADNLRKRADGLDELRRIVGGGGAGAEQILTPEADAALWDLVTYHRG